VKEIRWTDAALQDLAALNKPIARRVQQAVERFAGTGAGDVKKLRGISPPEYRLRVGDYRVRFDMEGEAIRVLRVRNPRRANVGMKHRIVHDYMAVDFDVVWGVVTRDLTQLVASLAKLFPEASS
jgi:mRNA interferase RelE/StbE